MAREMLRAGKSTVPGFRACYAKGNSICSTERHVAVWFLCTLWCCSTYCTLLWETAQHVTEWPWWVVPLMLHWIHPFVLDRKRHTVCSYSESSPLKVDTGRLPPASNGLWCNCCCFWWLEWELLCLMHLLQDGHSGDICHLRSSWKWGWPRYFHLFFMGFWKSGALVHAGKQKRFWSFIFCCSFSDSLLISSFLWVLC